MARLGPFERKPEIAVALSGGMDSGTLLHLTIAWANAKGGRTLALIVDHGLRANSAKEAQLVQSWARKAGAEAQILHWQHGGISSAIQQRARKSRYALMDEFCGQTGILHLLVAHHADDQSETIAMRQERHSGVRGLAGMSAIVEQQYCRILRPLLPVPRSRIEATAKLQRLQWIDDPTNTDHRFWRGAYRQSPNASALTPTNPAERNRIDGNIAKALAANGLCHPCGFFRLHNRDLAALDPADARSAISSIIRSIGGNDYGAGLAQLQQVLTKRLAGRTVTIGGVLIGGKGDWSWFLREPARAEGHREVGALRREYWDRRFIIINHHGTAKISVSRLDKNHVSTVLVRQLATEWHPASILDSIPMVKHLDGIMSVEPGKPSRRGDIEITFSPQKALTSAPFKA